MVLFTGLCYNHMHKCDTLPYTLYTLDLMHAHTQVTSWLPLGMCSIIYIRVDVIDWRGPLADQNA